MSQYNSTSSRPTNSSFPRSNFSRPKPSYGANRSGGASSSSPFGKPKFGGGSRFGGGRSSFGGGSSRFSGGRSSFGGGNSRFGGRGNYGRKRMNSVHLDEALFVMKAEPIEEAVAYIPKNQFSDFKIDEGLKENIFLKGYDLPTPIQDQTIPLILEGNDLLGIANTGTGKTAAFLVPLINKVLQNRYSRIVILVPTRELAEQIDSELFSLTKNLRIFSVNCIGGNRIGDQIRQINRGFNFIIGTPGRMNDLIERRILNMTQFDTVVLDEVDRMLDMGFVDEIKELIRKLPAERQSLFFSATVTPKIENLMKDILKPEYKKVSVKTGVTAKNVNQDVIYFRDTDEKITKLKTLIEEKHPQKILIFANTKREVDRLDKMLYGENYSVTSIHGDKKQTWRRKALAAFKKGHTNIMIATDVAARGLDINNVALVINYDIPNNHEDYIHRIGRTGRANKSGEALTFVRK